MKTIPNHTQTKLNIFTLVVVSGALLVLAGCGENKALEEKVSRLEEKVDELSEQNHKLQIEILALASNQKQMGVPGLLPAPSKASTYEEALSVLQEKEIRNRVLFKLKEDEFVPSFLQIMGPQYTGKLNELSQKRMELETTIKALEGSGVEAGNPRMAQMKSALDLINDRLLEEITSQKKAMEVDVQILREQVEAKKDEETK